MTSIQERAADLYYTAKTRQRRRRYDLEIRQARAEVDQQIAKLRAALAADRQRFLKGQPQRYTFRYSPGVAKRMQNLTYSIDDARQKALEKFRAEKQATMRDLIALLESGQAYSLRQLGALLNKAPNTIRNYKNELIDLGMLPATA